MLLLPIIIATLLGILAGGIINLLADELPYRRNPAVPVYPDGTPRPVSAWLGITAFLFDQRAPEIPQPDRTRARDHRETNKLSWRHPITEVATALLMVITVLAFPRLPGTESLSTPVYYAQLAVYLVYMAILVLITVIDIEHKLILFVVIVPSIILGLLDSIFLPQFGPNFQRAWRGGLLGFGVFFAMYLGGFAFNWIVGRMQNRRIDTVAFGYGDVMLITFTGIVVGLENVFFALFVTVFLGAAGAALYLVVRRFSGEYEAFTALPYGPYIVAGTIIMLLYAHPVQCAIWNWSLQGPC